MGKQNHLPSKTKAVGKNIKLGRGTDNSGKKIKISKMGTGKNIKLQGTLYTWTKMNLIDLN